MSEDRHTLLIVEDHIELADMLSAYFSINNYEVILVHRGQDGLKESQVKTPDLAILDIGLPDIDGYEVARQLRSRRSTESIPIIFLTEKRERANRLKGFESGADDYVTKPFDIHELLLRVRNAIRRSTQGSLTNPVTGLPEAALVDERLQECQPGKDWALVLVSLFNLDAFRESYGFVASDDVQRAITVMLRNAMQSLGNPDDFLGQLDPTDFLVITSTKSAPAISQRLRTRLQHSLDFFYPLKDRERTIPAETKLGIRVGWLPAAEGAGLDVAHIKEELYRRQT